ncbi:MAG TPA: hypothetical protein VJQ54_17940, partial [Candidatus Sulfotelmatobacter sp.]|nr:hypothetical protein [Candidatus Sulfotelmatobacter sp.]
DHRTPSWIVAISGINAMEQQQGGPQVVKKLLSDKRVIIVAANPLRKGLNDSLRGVSVLSADKCKETIEKPTNAELKTLLVDLESWPGTPKSDQENPEKATRQCHQLAHQDGRNITVIAVPAMDLMNVLEPNHRGTQYQAAIEFDLEGKLATASDGIEVQVENLEDNPEEFERTLVTMISQIKAAREKANLNTDIPIYAGLSTGVVAKEIPTDTLVKYLKEDIARTRNFVTGYWMAIPPKDLCPRCGDPNPEVAVKLLQSLDE